MLDESTQSKETRQAKDQLAESKVSCFVCKREVRRDQARQIIHSREKKVWVCEAHIK